MLCAASPSKTACDFQTVGLTCMISLDGSARLSVTHMHGHKIASWILCHIIHDTFLAHELHGGRKVVLEERQSTVGCC